MEGMGEDRRRGRPCHWVAAQCHMTLMTWKLTQHLTDVYQRLTQLVMAVHSGSNQGWCMSGFGEKLEGSPAANQKVSAHQIGML